MHWEVTLRRRNGRRIGKDEPHESAIGELTIGLLETRTGHRPRAATLVVQEQRGNKSLLPALLDPRLIYRRADAMVLAGIEVVRDGVDHRWHRRAPAQWCQHRNTFPQFRRSKFPTL